MPLAYFTIACLQAQQPGSRRAAILVDQPLRLLPPPAVLGEFITVHESGRQSMGCRKAAG